MRNFTLTLCALVALATAGLGQVLAPVTEDFETATNATAFNCGPTGFGVYSGGFTLDPSSTNSWRVDVGGTTSGSTGPGVDFTTGTSAGKYLYTETSGGCSATVATLVSPVYDVNALVTPTLSFAWHLFGATMGTLDVEAWDGSAWVNIYSVSGNQGDLWSWVQIPFTPYAGTGGLEAQFRFVGTAGSSFTSDMAIDEVAVQDFVVPEYQVNSDACSLVIDSTLTSGASAAVINASSFAATGVTATVEFSSTQVGLPYDIAFNSSSLIARSAGGLALGNDTVNLDFAGGLFFANGLAGVVPGGFLGGTNFSQTLTATFPAGITSLQAYAVDPTALVGFALSQATEVNASVLPPLTSLAGPVGDEVSVQINTGDLSTGTPWGDPAAGGTTFYGAVYNSVWISSNGRVKFDDGSTDFSVSVAEALTGSFVGYWTDLNPTAGTTNLSQTATGWRADWIAAPYFGGAATVTYGVEFDVFSGNITIDGLAGIAVPAAVSLLGASSGLAGGATDGGATVFAQGGSFGTPMLPTDMLYDISPAAGSAVPTLDPLVNALVPTSLLFTPDGAGNYVVSAL